MSSDRFERMKEIVLRAEETPCAFTRGITHIDLPVRHGEGVAIFRNAVRLAPRLVRGMHRRALRIR
jgi:phosphoribosylformylglycinamidine (FGAM) synthase-like amidotransferase family enzyme